MTIEIPHDAQSLDDDWFTPAELAAWLKITTDWIYDACQKQSIPHYRIGRKVRFSRSQLLEWLEANAVSARRVDT
jgi:excisionase family DNA binding protein